MTGFSRIIIPVFVAAVLLSAPAGAKNLVIDLGAGAHSIQADVQLENKMDMTTVYAGGGARYEEDAYTLFHVKGGLKQNVFVPALTLGMGFKGVGGNFEIKDNKYDLSVVGFTLLGRCDLARTAAAMPLTLYGETTFVPSPLCFIDCNKYLEFTTGLEINIIEKGAIIIEYNYIKAEFETSTKPEIDDSKGVLRLGFRLHFG